MLPSGQPSTDNADVIIDLSHAWYNYRKGSWKVRKGYSVESEFQAGLQVGGQVGRGRRTASRGRLLDIDGPTTRDLF